MEAAMSTSVPITNIPKIPPKPPHHLHHLKPSLNILHHPHISTSSTVTVTGTSISTKPSHKTHIPSHSPTSRLHTHHRNAATGYAAALVDAALCSNSLDAVHKDVKRLLKWINHNEMLKGLMEDKYVDECVKGKVVKEVAEKGRLRRQVVAVVKMLVAKNKSGMVVQVMEEFEGIYCQLNNNWVSA